MTFNLPYIVECEQFTKYFPLEKDEKVYGLSMLLRLNEINFVKNNEKETDPKLVK
jgi:hypothetical protein